MNFAAAGSTGLWLLEHGGLQAVTDLRTLAGAYHLLASQPMTSTAVLAAMTPANLDAATRTLNLLVTAVKDPSEKANLTALVQSL